MTTLKPSKKRHRLRPHRANEGIAAEYRAKLDTLIDNMHRSVVYWIEAAYKANEPKIAQDALPADAMAARMRQLIRQWEHRFDDAAPQLAEYFALAVSDRSDRALKKILRDGGFSVRFRLTPAQRDILKATVHENVALIKSIPAKYLASVEGSVMRSVQTGRDLAQLSKDLRQEFGVTKRRAALIARDQNNKATSALQRARQMEVGIKEGVWMHSHAGKTPRPTHVAMNGKRFDIAKGMYDSAEKEYVMPGQLINCRCTWRPIVEGYE